MADVTLPVFMNVFPFILNTGRTYFDNNSPGSLATMETLGIATSGPSMTDIYPTATGMRLVFDNPVNSNTPIIHAGPAGSPVVTGESQALPNDFTINYTLASPSIATLAPSLTGLLIGFTAPVAANAPVITPGPVGSPVISGSIQVNPTTVNLPWTVAAGLNLVSAICSLDKIDLTFDANIAVALFALNPALWSITSGTLGAVIPTVTSITYVGAVVTVHTTEATTGASYTLHAPSGAIYNIAVGAVWLATTANFTGVGAAPTVISAYAEDSTHIVLIFSEEVTESSATNIANYSIVPALSILSIVKVDAITYRMTVNPQTPGQSYSITITGVIDSAKNPI